MVQDLPQREGAHASTAPIRHGPKVVSLDAPPQLSHEALLRSHAATLAAPPRRYGRIARGVFVVLDVLFGRARTLDKFRVLEIVARVSYQAWEQAAYVEETRRHEDAERARRIYDRIVECRAQQDNEQWHLFILDELIAARGATFGRFRTVWLPQLIAFAYFQLSWLLYIVRPESAYRLNADFEDKAEHEYARLVEEHPEWESTPFHSRFAGDYGDFESLADLFRQISHDERFHKLESEQRLR